MNVIYNVTVNVEESVANEWLAWMRQTHIPDVMRTGMFLDYKILRIEAQQPEETGQTFAIQYRCESATHLDLYQKKYAPALQADHQKRYANKFVAFRTILHVLDEGQ